MRPPRSRSSSAASRAASTSCPPPSPTVWGGAARARDSTSESSERAASRVVSQTDTRTRSLWKLWLNHPERSRVRTLLFRVHVWIGAVAGAYIFVMSVSGSLIVFRNELYPTVSVEWLVNLHTNLLAGSMGRRINGIGAIGLALLCLTGAVIWWPGIRHWRRSLTVDWSARFP